MVTEEINPEDIMTEESWEEGWKEEDWEIDEITECPKCASKLEIKQFDVDFLNGRITVHGFEKMYCPACGYVFMNSKQAQLYEDLLDHFIEVDKHYSLTVQKMPVQGVKAEV
jgi:DNA-directed RNA polymerase subunit M/transcription elongation factor TFIIS